MWANRAWLGSVFERGAKPKDFLAQYARAFSSVEGNTTFYGIPSAATVQKWRDAASPGFRFAFKFPRAVSHDLGLRNADAATHAFFERLAPLGDRLGPFFLQLPPTFDDFSALERFLARLPEDFFYAVEPRHPAFYDEDAFERDFDCLLRDLKIDRVAFDTRRLLTYKTDDPEIRESQRKKPKRPPRTVALGQNPFLRYVGNPNPEQDREGLEAWAAVVAGWIEQGKTPYAFMHQSPEDALAPQLARMFHALVRERAPGLPPMPPWPGESEPTQLSLF